MCDCSPELKSLNLFEARGSYFFFTQQNPRNIFGTSLYSVELEDNYWFKNTTSVFVNANMTWAEGSTLFFNTRTDMIIPTLSLGVKEFFYVPGSEFSAYLGVGLSFALPYSHNYYEYAPADMVRFSPGLVFKSGFLVIPRTRLSRKMINFIADIFFDYYLQPTTQEIHASFGQSLIDVGGFRTGGGLGFLF